MITGLYSFLINNLSINWYANDYLMFKAQLAVILQDEWNEKFISPLSAEYSQKGQYFSKGELTKTETENRRIMAEIKDGYGRFHSRSCF